MVRYNLLDFNDFPTIYNEVIVPIDTIFIRGYDTKYSPIAQERPSYFTFSVNVARGYGELAIFTNIKPLRLFDLRYIKALLPSIFTRRKSNSQEALEAIYTLTLSYGLCSLEKQLEIFERRYRNNIADYKDILKKLHQELQKPTTRFYNPIELEGIRIGETSNDSLSVLLLKRLFPHIDGYVAPATYTPFHDKTNNVLAPEIVLFNPFPILKMHKDLKIGEIVQIPITNIIHCKLIMAPIFDSELYFGSAGGGTTDIIQQNDPNKLLDDEKEFKKLDKKASRIMKLFNGNENDNKYIITEYGRVTTQYLLDNGPAPWILPDMPK